MGWFSHAISSVSHAVSNAVSNPVKTVEGAGKTYLGVVGKTITGGASIAAEIPGVKQVLNNPVTDKLTFGYSKDFVHENQATDSLLKQQDPSKSDWQGTGRFAVKTGIALATAGAITSANAAAAAAGDEAAVSNSSLLTGYGIGQAASSGNIAGAVAGIGDLAGVDIPAPIEGALPNGAPPRVTSPRYVAGVSGYGPNAQYSVDPTLGSSSSSIDPNTALMILAGIIIAKKVLK